MDEATANIDIKTEQIIQKAINEILSDSTVITIAHRIKTIIHYDKIAVLSDGELMEFDSPENLIKDETSMFFEMYKKSLM
jgi:ATP-binding cassette subfamily C (CFTR/MRP) protein 1